MATAAPSTRITDFFLRLADDPRLLGEYGRDAEAAMAAAGLSAEQISTVVTAGAEDVRAAVERELAADPARQHLIVTPRMTTHTGPAPDGPPPPPPPPQPKPPPEPQRSRVPREPPQAELG